MCVGPLWYSPNSTHKTPQPSDRFDHSIMTMWPLLSLLGDVSKLELVVDNARSHDVQRASSESQPRPRRSSFPPSSHRKKMRGHRRRRSVDVAALTPEHEKSRWESMSDQPPKMSFGLMDCAKMSMQSQSSRWNSSPSITSKSMSSPMKPMRKSLGGISDCPMSLDVPNPPRRRISVNLDVGKPRFEGSTVDLITQVLEELGIDDDDSVADLVCSNLVEA